MSMMASSPRWRDTPQRMLDRSDTKNRGSTREPDALRAARCRPMRRRAAPLLAARSFVRCASEPTTAVLISTALKQLPASGWTFTHELLASSLPV